MQFYFIRHAQSENNALWAATGSDHGRVPDPDITSLGRQQAERLAHFLSRSHPAGPAAAGDGQNIRGFGLTHLYASLMLRAIATGTIVAQTLGLPLHGLEDIHEWGGVFEIDQATGEHRGMPGSDRAYLSHHYPKFVLPETLGETGWWDRPFEHDELRPIRAQRFLRDLLQKHGRSDDRVAVISHAGFYNGVMSGLLGLAPQSDHLGRPANIAFTLNNTAVSRIDFKENSVRLVYLNRADFLPEELIT